MTEHNGYFDFVFLKRGVRYGYPLCCIIAFWTDGDGTAYDPDMDFTGLPSGMLRGVDVYVPCWTCRDNPRA